MTMTLNQKTLFLHKIKTKTTVTPNGCVVWNLGKNRGGYGQFEYTDHVKKRRNPVLAHRLVYMLHHNVELTRWQFVCHSCDNPSCVNINHLWLGTAKDNNDDKIAKGRWAKTRSYSQRIRKYDDAIVADIKRMLLARNRIGHIAKLLQIPRTTVHDINVGKIKRDDSLSYPLRPFCPRGYRRKG